jgi:hypothetical protein
MRFIYGQGWRHVYSKEEDGEGGDGGGGDSDSGEGDKLDADTGDADADGAGGDGGEGDTTDADGDAKAAAKKDGSDGDGKGDDGEPKSMAEAIERGLAKTAAKPAAKKEVVEEDEAAKAAAAAEKHANGKPTKDAQGRALDDKGQLVKAKAKTSAELTLKPEELKALAPQTQQRFRELINTLKTAETEKVTLTKQMGELRGARDAMLNVMKEVGMDQQQFANYMEFHGMLSSGKPAELRKALEILDAQRASIYEFLGEEPPNAGVDLLAPHEDLRKRVEEEQLSRADALAIARGRSLEKQANTSREQKTNTDEQRRAREKASNDALASIDAWTAKLAAEDIDFRAKESKIVERVTEVIKNYPPDKWLSTLQLLYQGITVQKAGTTLPNRRPLRPSGGGGGTPQPKTMAEAIDQGLGYGQTG